VSHTFDDKDIKVHQTVHEDTASRHTPYKLVSNSKAICYIDKASLSANVAENCITWMEDEAELKVLGATLL